MPNDLKLAQLGFNVKVERDGAKNTVTASFNLSPAEGKLLFAYLVYSELDNAEVKLPVFLPQYSENNNFSYSFSVSDELMGAFKMELYHTSAIRGQSTYSVVGGVSKGKLIVESSVKEEHR